MCVCERESETDRERNVQLAGFLSPFLSAVTEREGQTQVWRAVFVIRADKGAHAKNTAEIITFFVFPKTLVSDSSMFTAFRKLLRLLPGQQQLTNLFALAQYIYISLVKAAVPRVFFQSSNFCRSQFAKK